MAPSHPGSKNTVYDPPYFSPTGDTQEWRLRVGKWVNLVKSAAEKGQDRSVHTIYQFLGHTLYNRGLPSEQQKLVDEAQKKREINYIQSDDPVKAALEIVQTVAVDPPILKVTRLINSFNKVNNFRRKKDEDIPVFLSRFRSLSSEHLEHSNSTPQSQIGQVLAITLLNNASLDSNTLRQCKLSLIELANARITDMEEGNVEVKQRYLSSMKSLMEKKPVLDASGRTQAIRSQARSRHAEELAQYYEDLEEEVTNLLESSGSSNHDNNNAEDLTDLFVGKGSTAEINLDDAVTVLRNLSSTESDNTEPITRKDLSALIAKEFQTFLGSVNNSNKFNEEGEKQKNSPGHHNRTKKSNREDSEDDNSEESGPKSWDCGSPNHLRGDPACKKPRSKTKKSKRRKSKKKDQYKTEEDDSFFGKGSGSSKSKKV